MSINLKLVKKKKYIVIIHSRLIISEFETKFSLYHDFDHLMLCCIPSRVMEFPSKVENVSFVTCLSNTSIHIVLPPLPFLLL